MPFKEMTFQTQADFLGSQFLYKKFIEVLPVSDKSKAPTDQSCVKGFCVSSPLMFPLLATIFSFCIMLNIRTYII